MLVLSRQRDETIMIGDDVEITVVDIRGDKVRLGITAPTRIAVHRKEVYEAIKAENERAARISGSEVTSLARTPSRITGPKPSFRQRGLGSPATPLNPNGQANGTTGLPPTHLGGAQTA